MNRGAGRRVIVQSDAQRQVFLAVLGEITATFGVAIHVDGLMHTNDHLLLQTAQGNLSRALRHLHGISTPRDHRRHRPVGPLFRGRFQAILVDADRDLAPSRVGPLWPGGYQVMGLDQGSESLARLRSRNPNPALWKDHHDA